MFKDDINTERHIYCKSHTPLTFLENALLGVITSGWKYIQNARPKLYDLVNNPDETNNILDEQPERSGILKDTLKRILAPYRQVKLSDAMKMNLDNKTVKQLESLGYIWGEINEEWKFDQTKTNAKDLIDLNNGIIEGKTFHFAWKAGEARAVYKNLIPKYPDSLALHFMIAVTAYRQNDLPGRGGIGQRCCGLAPIVDFIGDGRDQEVLDGFWQAHDEVVLEKIRCVCMDMWKSYINAVEANRPAAYVAPLVKKPSWAS